MTIVLSRFIRILHFRAFLAASRWPKLEFSRYDDMKSSGMVSLFLE